MKTIEKLNLKVNNDTEKVYLKSPKTVSYSDFTIINSNFTTKSARNVENVSPIIQLIPNTYLISEWWTVLLPIDMRHTITILETKRTKPSKTQTVEMNPTNLLQVFEMSVNGPNDLGWITQRASTKRNLIKIKYLFIVMVVAEKHIFLAESNAEHRSGTKSHRPQTKQKPKGGSKDKNRFEF